VAPGRRGTWHLVAESGAPSGRIGAAAAADRAWGLAVYDRRSPATTISTPGRRTANTQATRAIRGRASPRRSAGLARPDRALSDGDTPTPHDQPDLGRGGVAQRHRRTGRRLHTAAPAPARPSKYCHIQPCFPTPEVGMVKAMPLERRRKAALFRRVANIPTSGGRLADRPLLRLADQLDYEASCIEQRSRLAGAGAKENAAARPVGEGLDGSSRRSPLP
jgi:hypothetical protein